MTISIKVPLRFKREDGLSRHGPAAVSGDEIRKSHCLSLGKREGVESRKIRKSEDLPLWMNPQKRWTRGDST